MSRAPIISGTRKFPKPGEDRDDDQEDHRRPVDRDRLVVGAARQEVSFGVASCARISSARTPPSAKKTSAVQM